MIGETNLALLLGTMRPELQAGVYGFVTIPASEPLPEGLAPLMIFREAEGVTLIVTTDEAERAGLAAAYRSRMITLKVRSSLAAVGFLAAITGRLAEAGLSVNPVSAYFHDHLFVPEARAEDAMTLLQALSAGQDPL